MNSWFVTFNQKCNLCGATMTFKSSLLSRPLMLKDSVEKRLSEMGGKIWCFGGERPNKSEFEGLKPRKGTCTKQNTSFELSRVQIGSELRPVREMKKRKKRRTKVTKH